MHYKILQIKDLEKCPYSFMGWRVAQKDWNEDDYEVVYEGDLDSTTEPEQALEDLFVTFNVNHPADFKAHSLSVSDLVELEGVGTYYCDSVGWEKVKED